MQTFSDILMSILSGKRYETRVTPMTGGGLQQSVVTASKPNNYKEKAILKRRNPKGEIVPMQPFTATYTGERAIRTKEGGII